MPTLTLAPHFKVAAVDQLDGFRHGLTRTAPRRRARRIIVFKGRFRSQMANNGRRKPSLRFSVCPLSIVRLTR